MRLRCLVERAPARAFTPIRSGIVQPTLRASSGWLASDWTREKPASAFRDADGRRVQREGAEAVCVQLLGRRRPFTAIFEPRDGNPLVGAIALADLDLLVDCTAQRVVPRDPHGAIYEIE
jgi:hypothetical protein